MVYLAGPIAGLTYADATDWRLWFATQVAPIVCLDPMRGKRYLQGDALLEDSYPNHLLASAEAITTRDRFDVARCDMVVANLLGATRVSIGTVMECAWADMLRKPLVLVMERGNAHEHSMLRSVAGWVCPTLDAAATVVKGVL